MSQTSQDEPIDLPNWQSTPCLKGRLAKIEDVNAGTAAFHFENPLEIDAQPESIPLPSCAILTDDETGKPVPVIVIQAERSNGVDVTVGFRLLTGAFGVCAIQELELIVNPNAEFMRLASIQGAA